jgi:hypothetical protein
MIINMQNRVEIIGEWIKKYRKMLKEPYTKGKK